MECFICKKDRESTKFHSDWQCVVCNECDEIMTDGYNECYPDEKPEKESAVEHGQAKNCEHFDDVSFCEKSKCSKRCVLYTPAG